MFTETPDFDSPVTCTVDGFTLTATIERDDAGQPPWEREDRHGIVSDWTGRAKRPGEWVLCKDRGYFRYYDADTSLQIAKRDGWSAAPHDQGTNAERAARAVREDYERLQAWCRDDWCYVGVCVDVRRNGVKLTNRYDVALWGLESDAGKYLRDVANEMIEQALDAARKVLASLCDCAPA
jgi:hypothetical protein